MVDSIPALYKHLYNPFICFLWSGHLCLEFVLYFWIPDTRFKSYLEQLCIYCVHNWYTKLFTVYLQLSLVCSRGWGRPNTVTAALRNMKAALKDISPKNNLILLKYFYTQLKWQLMLLLSFYQGKDKQKNTNCVSGFEWVFLCVWHYR